MKENIGLFSSAPCWQQNLSESQGGQLTAASLMSHSLASTNFPAAGADLFTESKLQLPAGTDSCAPDLPSRGSRLNLGDFVFLEGHDV